MIPVLTPRETEVLIALADGRGAKETARNLGWSHHTIRTHVRDAFRKLDAATLIEAYRVLGWLRPPEMA